VVTTSTIQHRSRSVRLLPLWCVENENRRKNLRIWGRIDHYGDTPSQKVAKEWITESLWLVVSKIK
jgi:hypothetical protein